jgi:SPP1 family predicted phage head-tail adaptor
VLTTAELNRMREVAEQALPGTAVVQASTYVSDGGGGGSYTWANSGTLSCRVAPIAGGENQVGGRIGANSTHIVTLPWDAVVTEESRLSIGGGTFNIAHVKDRSYEITTRVEVVKQYG